jgi:hypothetical protein
MPDATGGMPCSGCQLDVLGRQVHQAEVLAGFLWWGMYLPAKTWAQHDEIAQMHNCCVCHSLHAVLGGGGQGSSGLPGTNGEHVDLQAQLQ